MLRADLSTRDQKYRGGVLLDKHDFELWDQWKSSTLNNFKGEFTITDYDSFHQSYKPDSDVENALDRADRKFVILFLYFNHSFRGELNQCRFWRTDV